MRAALATWFATIVVIAGCGGSDQAAAPVDAAVADTTEPQLPAISTVGVGFTAAAAGIAGGCFKNCTTDAECEPLGGYCEEGVGTGRKTCQFGVRPGTASDAGTD